MIETAPAIDSSVGQRPSKSRAAPLTVPFVLIFLSSSPLFILHLLPLYNAVIAFCLGWITVEVLRRGKIRVNWGDPVFYWTLLYGWILVFNLVVRKVGAWTGVYLSQFFLLILAGQSIARSRTATKRLEAAIVWIFAVLAAGQLLAFLLTTFGVVNPSFITLDSYFGETASWVPFLSFVSGESIRLLGVTVTRTSSFYVEPSAYVNALILPLLWSLRDARQERGAMPWAKFVLILAGGIVAGSVGFYIYCFLFLGIYLLDRMSRKVRAWRTSLLVAAVGIAGYSTAGLLSSYDVTDVQKVTNLIGEQFGDFQLLDKRSSFDTRAHWIQNDLETITANPLGVGIGDSDESGAQANVMSNAITTYLFSGPIGCLLLAAMYFSAFGLLSRQRGLSLDEYAYMAGGLAFLLLNAFVLSYTFYTSGNIILLSMFFGDAAALRARPA